MKTNAEIKNINLDDYEISKQSDEEIVLKKKTKFPKWEALSSIKGYFINSYSFIDKCGPYKPDPANRNTFLTEKDAKSALAMAQISQLMPYYGGEITDEEWEDGTLKKFLISRDGTRILSTWYTSAYCFLAFHTEEQRDAFLENNEQLVKDYLMIE